MLKKKSPGADLQSRRPLFFQIGMILTLAMVIAVFSWGRSEKNLMVVTGPAAVIDVDPIYIPRTETKPDESSGAAKITINVDVIDIVKHLTPPKTTIGRVPDPDEIFNDPGPVPTRFEKPEDDDTILLFSEDMPRFMGGDVENFRRWVLTNVVYPERALAHGITGRVRIEFVIEKDGSVSQVRIVESPDRLLSEAAVAVIERSPVWEPGRQRSKPVRVKFNIPVDFRIDRQ